MTTQTGVTSVGGGGYYCGGCGGRVSQGMHTCPGLVIPQQWPMPAIWTCGTCGQQVSGFHICSGAPIFMPIAAPEPEQRPESPLAALVADLRALLARGQSWLSERKL